MDDADDRPVDDRGPTTYRIEARRPESRNRDEIEQGPVAHEDHGRGDDERLRAEAQLSAVDPRGHEHERTREHVAEPDALEDARNADRREIELGIEIEEKSD